MTLPFEPAANPDRSASDRKWLVTLDWDGTLCLSKAQPNTTLYHFAEAAKNGGHDVVIATNNSDFEMLRMILEVHAMQLKMPSLDYNIISKKSTRDFVTKHGYGSSVISFDNEPETIPGYVNASFAGGVEQDGSMDKVELDALAAVLGITDNFHARLSQTKTHGPAGPFDALNLNK